MGDGMGIMIFSIVFAVICFIGMFIGLFYWLASDNHLNDCGKNMAEVMRKYSTMQPEDVNSSTISSFHKELRDCFDSDDAYSNYVNFWANNKSIEISNIDTMLLSYYTMNLNKDNDSLDTEPIDTDRYEKYM